jgi:hypothetical protein
MLKDKISYPTFILSCIGLLVCLLVSQHAHVFSFSEAEAKSADKPSTEKKSPGNIPSSPVIQPAAKDLIDKMGTFLNMTNQFSFHSEVMFDDHLPSGQKIQFAAAEDVSVRKPDRIYVDYQSDLGPKKFWYNGKTVTLLSPSHNSYSTINAPSNIESTIDTLMKDYGFTVPLGDFLFSDPHKTLMKNVEAGIYVGPGDVNGVNCQHLAFVEKYIDWQIWIEDGKEPIPRKVVITYKTMPGSPQYIAVLSDWNFEKSLPDSLFSADLPKDAKHIDFIKLKSGQKKLN